MWFSGSIDFGEISATNWILLAVLAACAAVLFASRGRAGNGPRACSPTAAICMALAFVLSYVRLFRLPQGGSVTAASLLPIIAFAYGYGLARGLAAGVAYGFLQMIQDPWIVSPVQAALDYPLAFAAIALAALARRLPERWGWLVAIALGGLGRFACHVLSGVVFFAEYAEGTGFRRLSTR